MATVAIVSPPLLQTSTLNLIKASVISNSSAVAPFLAKFLFVHVLLQNVAHPPVPYLLNPLQHQTNQNYISRMGLRSLCIWMEGLELSLGIHLLLFLTLMLMTLLPLLFQGRIVFLNLLAFVLGKNFWTWSILNVNFYKFSCFFLGQVK